MTVLPEKEILLRQEGEETVENDVNNETSGGGIFNVIKGITCTLGCAICFSVSPTSVQLLERRIPDLELNTYRNAIPLVLHANVFLLMQKWPVIERGKIEITFLYGVSSFVNGTCLFIALSKFILEEVHRNNSIFIPHGFHTYSYVYICSYLFG